MSDPVSLDLREYGEMLRDGPVEQAPGVLPAHWPTCFGCGPESQAGMHLVVRRVGQEMHATHTFAHHHAGSPGVAHGGTVAAVVDDVCGFVLYLVREPAVTRKLEIEYVKPVLIGVEYEVVARLDRREGRKLFMVCEGRNPEGVVTFRGNALFVVVGDSHFADAAEGSPPPVAR